MRNTITVIMERLAVSAGLEFVPTVRGTAMNPVDHPHGGGEGRA